MKAIRWILGFFIGIIMLCVVAIVLLVNFVNPNDFRDQINQTISQKIGRPFMIRGDINWLFFPELGFKVNDVMVGDNTDKKNISAKVGQLEINLKIWPLLHKQIAIDALKVHGLQLVLPYQTPQIQQPKQAKKTKQVTAVAETTANMQPQTSNPVAALAALPDLKLAELAIDGADISQLGPDNKQVWALHNFAFSAINLNPQYQFPFQTSFDFVYPSALISGKVNFKSYFDAGLEKGVITFSEPVLSLNAKKTNGMAIQADISLKKVDADFANRVINLDKLKGKVNNLAINGDVTVKSFDKNPVISGQMNAQSANLRDLLKSFGVSPPETQKAGAFGKFSLDTTFNFANNQLNLKPLKINLDDINVEGSVASSDVKNMALAVNLNTSAIAAGNYLAKSSTPKTIDLSNLQLNLQVLPPAGDNKNWLASAASGNVVSQAINFNGQKFNNVQLVVDAKNQVININKMHANAWQGSLDATGQINLQGAQPRFAFSPVMQNISIQAMLSQLQPKVKIDGIANLSGNISTAGADAATLTRNLNGALKAYVNNGVLHGINVDYWSGVASALLNREPLPPQPQNNTTAFDNVSATLSIAQGVVTNRDLLIQTNFARATGAGIINLNNQALNYRMQIVKMNQATGGTHQDVVPLIITGTFDNPHIVPDMAAIAQQVVSKQFDKRKDDIAQRINQAVDKNLAGAGSGNQVGQQITNALGNLLGAR